MNIQFNWFPPAFKKIPSPAMSILKGYLSQYGYNSSITYWNLILGDIIQKCTSINEGAEANEFDALVPFLPILLSDSSEKEKFDRLCVYYQSKFPQYFNIDKQKYYNSALQDYSNQILERFYEIIKLQHLENRPDLVGVNISLLQLIPANIYSNISKQIFPNIPIVAGGISNKNEAIAILDNFNYYDYAIWGEGENPLHQLCRAINAEIPLNEVPNLVYRTTEDGVAYNTRKKVYSQLSQIKSDFSDYFNFKDANKIYTTNTTIPVESSRGCHWNRCKFCFLTEGYKNRAKENDAIINEILQSIEKYNIFHFVFLDNDIIFDNIEKFNNLLNQFIDIKDKYEQFGIWNGEVVTKGLNADIIKKMTLAGFKSIQIGYESVCDSLLRKINKKNTFSSNLMFVKWACEYNLSLQGLNIITGLIEEDDVDIKKSIKNLHYLRFYLDANTKHTIVPLQIMSASRYYKELQNVNKLDEWNVNPLYSLLPSNYIRHEQRFDIIFFAENNRNPLWENFEIINKHYSESDYKYKIYLSDSDIIQYVEFLNGVAISKLEFNPKESYHWNILQFCNKEVKSFEQIIALLNLQDNISAQDEVKNALIELNEEFLLYSNPELTENITIINTDTTL